MLSYGLGDAGTGLANAQFGFYLFPSLLVRRAYLHG